MSRSASSGPLYHELSLLRAVSLFGSNKALIFEGNVMTYKELNEYVNSIAHMLIGHGVKKQDHVAFMGQNSDDMVALYLACSKIGAIMTPLNWRLTIGEAQYIIHDSESVVVVVDPEYVSVIEPARVNLPTVRHYFHRGNTAVSSGWIPFSDLKKYPHDEVVINHLSEDDQATQMYTSGTTGNPKGVILTHRNIISNIFSLMWSDDSVHKPLTVGDVVLVAAPLYHAAAFISMSASLAASLTLNIKRSFVPQEVIKSILREGVSGVTLVPSMLVFLINQVPNIDKMDLKIKSIRYGGSSIPVEVLKRSMEVFKESTFGQGFGQTESVAVLTQLKASDHLKAITTNDPIWIQRLKSAGKAIPGVQIRIVDENDKDVPIGKVGEIIARGPNVMKGYWKMPEATADTLKNGWLHTGDLGYMDEGHYVYIVDRIKDMIITGGENVYSREVEEVLFEHPGIADAAVVGIPDDKWGELVVALIVPKGDGNLSSSDITSFCRTKLAGFKIPKRIEYVKEIPKNPSGKMLKRVIRQQLRNNKSKL